MKKIIFIILLVAALFICACSDMAQGVRNADRQDLEVLRWDESKWDRSEWGE